MEKLFQAVSQKKQIFSFCFKSLNGKHELTIKNCKPEDLGKYMFVAKEAKCEALITVLEEPVKLVKRLQDQDGLENTPVTFECELNKPNVPVEWLFNDQPIEKCLSADSYIISQMDNKYTLVLPKCQLQNQGMFTLAIPGTTVKCKALLNVDGEDWIFISRINEFDKKIFIYFLIKQKLQQNLNRS